MNEMSPEDLHKMRDDLDTLIGFKNKFIGMQAVGYFLVIFLIWQYQSDQEEFNAHISNADEHVDSRPAFDLMTQRANFVDLKIADAKEERSTLVSALTDQSAKLNILEGRTKEILRILEKGQ